MILAAAQTIPQKQDFNKNLEDHLRLTTLAAENGAQLLIFPEMSLTGYERDFAAELAITPDDSRLDSLRKLAADKNIIIVAGAPIKQTSGLHIGAFILYPNDFVSIYTKQYLHAGEELFFKPGNANAALIELNKERLSIAICADICNPLHAENAVKLQSTIYLACLFYTPNGIPEAFTLLSQYAQKHSMSVLMANFGGPSGGWEAGGQSAFWNAAGELQTKLSSSGEGLLVVSKEADVWQTAIF